MFAHQSPRPSALGVPSITLALTAVSPIDCVCANIEEDAIAGFALLFIGGRSPQ
jgi:hypothetical protein